MSFSEDLKFERDFYHEIFKPWLNSRGNDSIFIHFDSKSIIYEALQKTNDIDVILDNKRKNISLSLKTVRKIYDRVFFETISNCATRSSGWGFYSQADWIVYSMGDFQAGFTSKCFKIKDIVKLSLEKYPKGYGKTYDRNNNLLYKTEGRLIPFTDFKHYVLFQDRLPCKELYTKEVICNKNERPCV